MSTQEQIDEKAKELYDKFEKMFINANADSWGKEAKQCAKEECDAVLNVLQEIGQSLSHNTYSKEVINSEYLIWVSIKTAIEKM